MATQAYPIAVLAGDAPDEAAPVIDLLGRWLDLGEIERRAFIAMVEELTASAGVIEQSTIDLSARFRELAVAAEVQTGLVARVAGLAKTLTVDGEALPVAEATRFVGMALAQAIDALEQVSIQAGRMAEALDLATVEVAGAEQCVARIEAINKQARFVALNAAIEAHRAEGAGGTFRVIAHELKELAQETDGTSSQVRERITAVARGVRGAHAQLLSIAGADRSAQTSTRDRLSAVLDGMLNQNEALSTVLSEALQASGNMAETVARLVTGAQFQDRTTQHLTHVTQALGALGEATEALQRETRDRVPSLLPLAGVDAALLQRMLDRQTLSSVRQRFLARLLDDQDAAMPASNQSGEVELF
ncbi:methyl-accepting chemotaxis protein [Dankookia sp. GCM10030260]|uniref:methyl-accepting chemotaxis protein n=1 Tax=Dankookia sp. GCM10030260 TaxID=3273390 RepID=UPI0036081605